MVFGLGILRGTLCSFYGSCCIRSVLLSYDMSLILNLQNLRGFLVRMVNPSLKDVFAFVPFKDCLRTRIVVKPHRLLLLTEVDVL